MWKIVGRGEILKLLCTQFFTESNNSVAVDEQEPNILDEMTQITSDIIRDRDTKSRPHNKPNINNMPSCLVGTIASFLTQWDYIAFSMTNRKVYLDCNSPNRLQKLALSQYTDYSTVSLKQFPQIKYLRFNLKQMSGFKEIGGRRFGDCNQLQTLLIDGTGSTTADMDLLINDSSRCFSTIRSLVLFSFSGRSNLASNVFIQILSKFDKLAHLQLYGVDVQGDLNSYSISLLCPEIKEFISCSTLQIAQVLQCWKGRIDTLTIGEPARGIPNCDIFAVKRLCFVRLEIAEIDSLLNLSKTLRQISWFPNVNL